MEILNTIFRDLFVLLIMGLLNNITVFILFMQIRKQNDLLRTLCSVFFEVATHAERNIDKAMEKRK